MPRLISRVFRFCRRFPMWLWPVQFNNLTVTVIEIATSCAARRTKALWQLLTARLEECPSTVSSRYFKASPQIHKNWLCQSNNSDLNVEVAELNLTALKWVLGVGKRTGKGAVETPASGIMKLSVCCSLPPFSPFQLPRVSSTSTALCMGVTLLGACSRGKALQMKHQRGKWSHPGWWNGQCPSLNLVKADRQLH